MHSYSRRWLIAMGLGLSTLMAASVSSADYNVKQKSNPNIAKRYYVCFNSTKHAGDKVYVNCTHHDWVKTAYLSSTPYDVCKKHGSKEFRVFNTTDGMHDWTKAHCNRWSYIKDIELKN